MTASKEKEKEEINLEKVIADYGSHRYEDVVLAMNWAAHLKNTEEYKLKPVAEIIEAALKDVVSKKVTAEEIKKAIERDREIKESIKSEKKENKKEKSEK